MNTVNLSTTLLAAERHSAPIKHLGGLLTWTAVFVVLIICVYALMWRAWRRRAARQEADVPELASLPEASDEPELRLVGMYHGSTRAGDWLGRIVARGLGTRGRVEATLTEAGVEMRRAGARNFLIPADAVLHARTDRGIAGKVVSAGGLLVITWELGGQHIDSGMRSDHPDEHPRWVEALTAEQVPSSAAPTPVPPASSDASAAPTKDAR